MIHRGEIYWVDLRQPTGSEPGRRRPVLVVSSDRFNQSRIDTVLAVAITSNLRLADAPGNVELPSETSGLDRDSVANVSQIVTIDKAMLNDWVGRVDLATMRLIEAGMGLALDLPFESR